MQLLLKNDPVLNILDNGTCQVLDFDRLPFGLRKENETGKLLGYVPLFDHDHAFSSYENVYSQTTEKELTLEEAAVLAQRELCWDITPLLELEKPELLSEEKWQALQKRCRKIM